jgi:hypothetical protein
MIADRHPIRAHPSPLATRLQFARNWIAPPNSSNFSVSVVLPASGCEMIATVPRRKISSGRVLTNPLYLSLECRPSLQAARGASALALDMMPERLANQLSPNQPADKQADEATDQDANQNKSKCMLLRPRDAVFFQDMR